MLSFHDESLCADSMSRNSIRHHQSGVTHGYVFSIPHILNSSFSILEYSPRRQSRSHPTSPYIRRSSAMVDFPVAAVYQSCFVVQFDESHESCYTLSCVYHLVYTLGVSLTEW